MPTPTPMLTPPPATPMSTPPATPIPTDEDSYGNNEEHSNERSNTNRAERQDGISRSQMSNSRRNTDTSRSWP